MRVVFCDDDSRITAQLTAYISEYFRSIGGIQPEMAAYTSGDELLQQEQRVDLAFLDVEMPGQNGISVGAALKARSPHVKIFMVTSYPDYLDDAMRFQVFRYLSKPIEKDRLLRNLKDALYQYNMETREFSVLTAEGIVVRRAEEIICVEATQRKSLLHTTTGDLLSTDGIEHWRQMLTLPCFYVSHRSFIVNMRFVSAIEKDVVILKCGEQQIRAFLTRRRYTQFKDTYLMYLESTR